MTSSWFFNILHENMLSAAELLHMDRRTDITKRMAAYRNIANAPTTYRVRPQASSLKFKVYIIRSDRRHSKQLQHYCKLQSNLHHRSSNGNSQFQQRYSLQLTSLQSYPSSMSTSFSASYLMTLSSAKVIQGC